VQTIKSLSGRLIVHVFFGSEDIRGNTLRFAQLLLELNRVQEIRVAVSASFADTASLEALRHSSDGRMSWQMVGSRMAEHMAGCDVAVGAPGQATWERACLGLPALYIAVSDTQIPVLERLGGEGFCVSLGSDRDLSDESFRASCEMFLSNTEGLQAMRAKATSIVDGMGSSRVADALGALSP
jgi:spore coat polysaccharide biosynthesis predicted glycosyltransferase SpsG